MHVIVWEFLPRVGKEPEFERAYGSTGEWAKLFAQSADYRGTELLKSREGNTYLTFDRWTSVEAFAEFKQRWHAEYSALDKRMGSLTENESSIGEYESV
jgi:heme-degrading monooxygenase HmoA